MEEKTNVLGDLFLRIANAIRGKTGENDPIAAENFPDKIASIDTTPKDALFLTKNPETLPFSINSIIYAQEKFIAVSTDGELFHSLDGLNWSKRDGIEFSNLKSILFNNGLFSFSYETENSPETIALSTDALEFVHYKTINEGTVLTPSHTTFYNGIFTIFVPEIGIKYSEDCVTWKDGIIFNNKEDISSVLYGGGIFVATSQSKVFYSSDGINWYDKGLAGGRWTGLSYNNNKFFAVCSGEDDNGSNQGAFSSDGENWTPVVLPFSAKWKATAYGFEKYVAICEDQNKIAYSTDGENWAISYLPKISELVQWDNLIFDGRKFLLTAKNSDVIVLSDDGINWYQLYDKKILNYHDDNVTSEVFDYFKASEDIKPEDVVKDKTVFGVDGLVNGTNPFKLSDTFFESEISSTDRSSELYSVAYGMNRFVAVGYAGACFTSIDGEVWEPIFLPADNEIWSSVYYVKDRFVAFGKEASKVFAYSFDGLNWKICEAPASAEWKSIACGETPEGKGIYVMVGNNTIAYSDNAIKWELSPGVAETSWVSIAYGKDKNGDGSGKFVVISGNMSDETTVSAYSGNGINWNTMEMKSAYWGSLAYGDGRFVATSCNNTNYFQICDNVENNWSTVMDSSNKEILLPKEIYAQNSLKYINGKFVSIANSTAYKDELTEKTYYKANILCSKDGKEWTLEESEKHLGDLGFGGLAHGLDRFVAVGFYNGILSTNNAFKGKIVEVQDRLRWGNLLTTGTEIIGFSGKKIAKTTDFMSWTDYGELPDNVDNSWKILYANNTITLVDKKRLGENELRSYANFNGTNWTTGTMNVLPGKEMNDLVYNHSRYVASPSNENKIYSWTSFTSISNYTSSSKTHIYTTNKMATSTGTNKTVIFPNTLNGQPFNSIMYITGTSKPGSNYVKQVTFSSTFDFSCNGAAYANEYFLGWGPEGQIIYAPEGSITSASGWKKMNGNLEFVPIDIISANNKFIALHKNKSVIAVSSNASKWTYVDLPFHIDNVIYLNGKYYGTSTKNCLLLTSDDGIEWSYNRKKTGMPPSIFEVKLEDREDLALSVNGSSPINVKDIPLLNLKGKLNLTGNTGDDYITEEGCNLAIDPFQKMAFITIQSGTNSNRENIYFSKGSFPPNVTLKATPEGNFYNGGATQSYFTAVLTGIEKNIDVTANITSTVTDARDALKVTLDVEYVKNIK